MLQKWWVSLALLLALAGGVWLVAVDSANRGQSERGWLARLIRLERLEWSGEFLPQPEVYVVLPPHPTTRAAGNGVEPTTAALAGATEGKLRVIDPERESWDELGGLMESGQERLAKVTFEGSIGRRGIWAATREERNAVITVEPIVPGSFSAADLAEARRLAAAHFQQEGIPEIVSLARAATTADLHERRVVWKGVGANLGMAVLAAAWLVSLGFVPRMLAARRARLGARRLAHGRCPGCSYELVGLEAAQCPECGAALPGRSAIGAD